MINGLKPYPKMKHSVLPWLGDVPEHWTEKRAKYFYREADERSVLGDEELLSVSHKTGVTPRKQSVTMFLAESTVGYKICRPGDVAINTMWAFMGAMGVARQVGLVSPAYGVYRPHKADAPNPDYLDRLLRLDAYKSEYTCRSTGINSSRLRLYPDEFLRIPIICPPPAEQTAIVRFLNHADRKIRRYIRAKQKLIKLLEEQKQAIIHRAVTRGLDPDVRLKPSGVEWLGDVPEHWEVTKLGRLIELTTGFPFKSDGFTQDAEDIRLLRGVNISPGKIRWSDVVRWPISELEKYDTFALQNGDIVLGMDRPIIQRGTRVTRVNEPDVPALLLQRVARLRPRLSLHGDYLLLLLAGKSFANYLSPIFTGISVPHLSPEQIRSFRFALPPVDEQRQVIGWVEDQTRKTSTAIMSAELEIDILQEYRTRLIADVATGNLDVREVAAGLPEEAEPMDSMDPDDDLQDLEDLDPEAEEQTEDP